LDSARIGCATADTATSPDFGCCGAATDADTGTNDAASDESQQGFRAARGLVAACIDCATADTTAGPDRRCCAATACTHPNTRSGADASGQFEQGL
jgi:hypothetical protein